MYYALSPIKDLWQEHILLYLSVDQCPMLHPSTSQSVICIARSLIQINLMMKRGRRWLQSFESADTLREEPPLTPVTLTHQVSHGWFRPSK